MFTCVMTMFAPAWTLDLARMSLVAVAAAAAVPDDQVPILLLRFDLTF